MAVRLPNLSDLIASLALDAINTQVLFDAGHAEDREEFAKLLANASPEQQVFLRPLAPSHLKISEMNVELSAMLSTSREQTFSIQALPLNLQASIRHRLDATRYSRIRFCVQQIPAPQIKENADVGHE